MFADGHIETSATGAITEDSAVRYLDPRRPSIALTPARLLGWIHRPFSFCSFPRREKNLSREKFGEFDHE